MDNQDNDKMYAEIKGGQLMVYEGGFPEMLISGVYYNG